MSSGLLAVITVVGLNLILILVLLRRPALLQVSGGRVLAFLAILAMPVAAFSVGLGEHVERSKRTEFCVSCHVMEPYGRSLLIDSVDHLPAQHAQNARVDGELSCFVCHTNYTMFGDIQSKITGVRHVWINYMGTIPEELSLYQPYQNRECLYCHGEARFFNEGLHGAMRAELDSNEVSCLECHTLVHDVENLDALEMWESGR
jgi:cytochrome c-type protein NapC